VFNFEAVPTVVGGPYEYGVPGAVHGIFKSPTEAKPVAAGVGGGARPPGSSSGEGGSA
jgi:cytochrome c oxidase subunit 1